MMRKPINKRLWALFCALAMLLSMLPTAAAAESATPASSNNKNKQDYTTYASTVKSHLYADGNNLVRVEYINGRIVVETYDSSFALLDGRTIPMELSIWGGFFAGRTYNFLVFGQTNPQESDSVEVIRVVKYSKDWQRLGQASLRGANTTVPFDAGSLRCDEYGGYLYIRTCHEMYRYTDGVNHQANLTFAVKQSDMSVSDSFYEIANHLYGYVSHSFNQHIIVDEDGLIVVLDHGDAAPTRGVNFMRYYADAGTGKFTNAMYGGRVCSSGLMLEFAGASGNNTTGGSIGGLGETTGGYVMAYNYDGVGGSGPRAAYYHYMDKPSGRSWSVQLTNAVGVTTPVLAPTGLDGGYVLWNGKSGYTVNDTLSYIRYGADGTPGKIQTAKAPLSDCKPIYHNGKLVWYVTDNSAPTFYTLDGSGVKVFSTAGAPTPTPTPTPAPTPTATATATATPTPTPTPAPTPTPTPSARPDSCASNSHKWGSSQTLKATCQAEGKIYRICTLCGEENVVRTLPKSSHSWKYETEKATCTAEGRYIRTCTVCGTEELVRTLSKTNHQWKQVSEPATTMSAGRVYRVCTVCSTEETLSVVEQKLHNGSGSTSMAKLTREEITRLLADAPITYTGELYVTEPSVKAPYSAGKLTSGALQATLNRLNAMRRIAGLPPVALDDTLVEKAQHGAVLLAASGFSHYPDQPADMSDSFYKIGYEATSSSNIAWGYSLVGSVDGWMSDDDASNVDGVGHRRWQLNPTMGKVGFGYANSRSAEWALDTSGAGCDYDYVAWPASGNFPSSLMHKNTPWSVSLNPKVFASPSSSKVTVTLTNEAGRSWSFQGSYAPADSGKYFTVSMFGYGSGACVIFRPDGISDYEGAYTVTINGLEAVDGKAAQLSYKVEFFDADNSAAEPTPTPTPTPKPAEPFTDVDEDDYYYDAVVWAYENEITTGTTATRFGPFTTCTREQAMTFLWRANGCPEPVTTRNPFTDIKPADYSYKAILWAYENGITTGVTTTTFGPKTTCSRAHLITFLWRTEHEPKAKGGQYGSYGNTWYSDAAEWADSYDMLDGTAEKFTPKADCPRADMMVYMYRALEDES